MTNSASTTHRVKTWIACLSAAWTVAAAAAMASETEKTLLANGSFEAIATVKAPTGNEQGAWLLKTNLQAPSHWRLSSAFPGDLEVVEDDAYDGKCFLRLAARPERATHLTQQCPGFRRGLVYQVSLRYRGGPVELKVYEYDDKGKLKADRAFAKGKPTPSRDGAWQTLVGIYTVPNGISKVTLALAVPAAGEVDLDDVRVSESERSAERVNVRDFGASGSEFETTCDTTAGGQCRYPPGCGRLPARPSGGGLQVQSPCHGRLCLGKSSR